MPTPDASEVRKIVFSNDDRMQYVLERARQDAFDRKHRCIMAAHVLLALLEDREVRDFMKPFAAEIPEIRQRIHSHLKTSTEYFRNVAELEVDELPNSPGMNNILQQAATIAHENKKAAISPLHVLHAIMKQSEGQSIQVLHDVGITEADVARYLAGNIEERATAAQRKRTKDSSDDEKNFKIFSGTPALEAYTTNLTERAKNGQISAVTGRDTDIGNVVQTLNRLKKNNPLIVGVTGTGRRTIVEGLAYNLVFNPPANKKFVNANIFVLNTNKLMAGAKFQGDIEERLKNIATELADTPNAILYIDDLHVTTSAGRGSSDMSASIKAMLSSGQFRCIARESTENYRRVTQKDSDYDNLFQKINVGEPTVAETYDMVASHRARIEEGQDVVFREAALKACTDLAARYLHEKALPGKAVDLAEEVASRASLQGTHVIERDLVEEVVAILANIPKHTVNEKTREQLKTVNADLKGVVFHQDEAIDAVTDALHISYADMNPPGRPVGSFIFSGPTGVGKTEVAKKLAEILGIEFVRFDMTEFSEKHSKARLIGAPPGYVGYEGGGQLTEAVSKKPHCVLLLDEIEKAHPEVLNVLLQVMDDARLTDGQGRGVKFDNTIIIMTTNAGAVERKRKRPGFTASAPDKENEALKELLLPEFRNRVDEVIEFRSLDQGVMSKVVTKFMKAFNDLVTEKNIHFTLTPGATNYLATAGFDQENGARPMARTITKKIKRHMAREALFGRLQNGGHVLIDFTEAANDSQRDDCIVVDKLSFTFSRAANDKGPPKITRKAAPQPA